MTSNRLLRNSTWTRAVPRHASTAAVSLTLTGTRSHPYPLRTGRPSSRSLSTSPPPPPPSSPATPPQTQQQPVVRAPMMGPTTARDKLEYAKAQATRIGRYVLFGTGAYAIYWIATEVTGFFVGFSLLDVGEIGFFIGGAFSTLLLGAALVGTRRLGVRSPQRAIHATLQRLELDPTLRTRMGGHVRLGGFQAAAHVGGFKLKPLPVAPAQAQSMVGKWAGKMVVPQWTGPQRLNLVFHLHGPTTSAVVSADLTRRFRGPYTYRSLVVDVDSTGERLVYQGTERDVLFKGLLRLR
ncbi:hypothetical protein BCR44DRAFT_122403 [Catenaria anguillulae PL171]|uniref:Uncharacterized protein n=1 Tax=Catenaria anguillulae PL171 TaxID=765915 RepID=A0A1Y2HHG0_9FUNG|nr:hypothetical protein BCR44DRAFT_122403 [Catenaria anguillulae PL171]